VNLHLVIFAVQLLVLVYRDDEYVMEGTATCYLVLIILLKRNCSIFEHIYVVFL